MQNSEKFKGKYRIKSCRLQGYDYSSEGAYFITICTQNRECFFGNIADKKMQLSKIGEIVANEWQKTAEIRGNVELGEWVVMPNHFHGIVIIQNMDIVDIIVETPRRDIVETPRRGVSTGTTGTTERNPNHKPQWKQGCLGAIINQFKSICTKQIRQINPDFAWQSRFHDHIIRSEEELNRISEYIISNPQNWNNDRNRADNIYF